MRPDFQQKIVSLPQLQQRVASARREGKTVVQCHGCFDLVHPGHIRYLEFARRQGDLLIVSLTGDRQIGKGDLRPYIPQELRAENLAALVFVDLVYIDPNPTAEELLGAVRPDIYVKGQEYEHSTDPGFLAEQHAVESYGGRLIFSSGEVVFSSTKLIESTFAGRSTPSLESERLRLLAERYGLTAGGLAELVRSFAGLRVVVVGDVILDRYVECDAVGVASESPMMSLAQLDETTYVGGAAIVARHAAALGAEAFLLSAAGLDETSQRVRSLLTAEGVEAELLACRPDVVEKTRFLVGENKLFKLDRAQRLPLDSAAQRRAVETLTAEAKLADAVIFCDFGYGMITGGLLAEGLPIVRKKVGTISADVSTGRGNLLNFTQVDLLCPTEREARATLNDFDSGLSHVAWELLNRTQARHLLLTLEKRGLVVFQRRSQDPASPEWSARLTGEQVPSLVSQPVDVLGCGDALLAASTLALAAGAGLAAAAYVGSAAAAVEAGLLGNHPVSASRLLEWSRGRPELQPRTQRQPQAGVAGSPSDAPAATPAQVS